jgi:omega-hydroxy-beta-dihydromenaquinone-9 sulfotransferase
LNETIRDYLNHHLFCPLQGMSIGTWLSVLRRNRFAVDPAYWPRALIQTGASLVGTGAAGREAAEFGPRVEAVQVRSPLFILGHFRSGTTHLHNLLALDKNLAAPSLYETLYPATFLRPGKLVPRIGGLVLPRKRPQDDIDLGFQRPNEDEVALCILTGLSPYLAWAFPRQADYYGRYLTFESVPEDELGRWKAAMVGFLKKLTWEHGKPLVLKSPPHTARVRLLLELFPDARFVHIRRHPYAVFRSTKHLHQAVAPYWRLQGGHPPDDDRIIATYLFIYEKFLNNRNLIPHGRLFEVSYEDLEVDPIGQLEAIYHAFDLPGFAATRPIVRAYLDSIAGYRKNRHPELPEALRLRIRREWRRSFEEWDYAP